VPSVLECLPGIKLHAADRVSFLPGELHLGHRRSNLPGPERGSVEPELVCDRARQEEPLADQFLTPSAKRSAFFGVPEQIQRLLSVLTELTGKPPTPPWNRSGIPPAFPVTTEVDGSYAAGPFSHLSLV
jgi:hypothetical protein